MRLLILIPFILPCLVIQAQNGKIIQQTVFTPADSSIQLMERTIKDIRPVMAAVNFYRITYLSDGLQVKGYLAIPKKQGKYPCIIFNRGGNKEFSAITDEGFLRNLGKLSREGYVIIASQYRGNAGGEGKEEYGGSDVQDVLHLIPALASLPQADTSRIGMFGWSRGGMMTYIALTKTTKIKAAVVGSGLTDLKKLLADRPAFDSLWITMMPDYATRKEELLTSRSATYFADKIARTTPILILQGTADWRVPTDQVLDLVQRFYQLQQPFRFILYEGGQHSLAEFRDDYYTQMINWFNTYLRDRKPWPSLEPHGN
jgi:dipeptidyl aminopeptidase/acylaminoacyl peptidase